MEYDESQELAEWVEYEYGGFNQLKARIAELESVLKAVKVRICYVGHPKERIVCGMPDWSDEIALIESAMNSSPDQVPEGGK